VPLLISDKVMPDMDGLELCHRIRAANRKKYTYIIMLTGSDIEAGFLTAMEAGVDDYIAKPFVEEQLAARLRVAQRILRLQEEIKELRVRVCCYCRSMLNDDGQWVPEDPSVEKYRNVALSHGICPACWQSRVAPQLEELRRQKQSAGS
jgi:DNA-binding response OmpR family regulator